MGGWFETDFVTRLAIEEGEPVLMMLSYDRDGKKKYTHGNDPISDTSISCGGLLKLRPYYDRIKCFFGKYGDCGWIKGLDRTDSDKGITVFMRKETYDFIRKEMEGLKNSADEREKEDAMKTTTSDRAKGMLERYGYAALQWGIAEMLRQMPEFKDKLKSAYREEARRKYKNLSEERLDAIAELTYLWDNKDTYFMRFCQREFEYLWTVDEIGTIQKYAEEYHDVIQPVAWYCEFNRICMCGGIPFPQQYDNYDMIERLSAFSRKQAKKLIKKYNEDDEE